MGFRGVLPLAQAVDENGKNWQSFFYKTTGPTQGTAGRWCDAAVGAGIPVYQAYVGTQYEATPLIGAANRGIYAGPAPSAGETKHLFAVSAGTSGTGVPLTLLLCDYVLFYPLVDMDSIDTQVMDNTAPLPRYSDGDGIMVFFSVAAPMTGSGTLTINYTNQAGVSGRTASIGISTSTVIGALVNTSKATTGTGALSPFIPLASGDTGIRSVESVTCGTAMGGFCNLILVKPLASLVVRERNTQAEKILLPQNANCPEVKSGAYLNFLTLNGATATYAPLRGFVQFAWS